MLPCKHTACGVRSRGEGLGRGMRVRRGSGAGMGKKKGPAFSRVRDGGRAGEGVAGVCMWGCVGRGC